MLVRIRLALKTEMPRKKLIKTNLFPYHIVNRSNNRDFFCLSMDVQWDIFIRVLQKIRELYLCKIHAFVLMSNHYHLVISTPMLNLSETMTYFHREVARKSNHTACRINHFFGGRYKWCLINEEMYYWQTLKYVFRNPVTAKICQDVKDYRFSSLNSSHAIFSHDYYFRSSNHISELDLNWLNQDFEASNYMAIQKALRRRTFKLPNNKNAKKIILASHPKKELGTL